MIDLAGKHILVTGGAHRIGKAFTQTLLQQGAMVSVHYNRSAAEAQQLLEESKAGPGTINLVQADFSDPLSCDRLMEQTLSAGPLFALVNSSAVFFPQNLAATTLESWQQTLTINLTLPFLLSQSFAAQLPSGQQGRILNILDWRAKTPDPKFLAYSVTKAGLQALTKALALELAPRITVNGLALGAILPPEDTPPASNILAQIPAGRWANLSELQEAFLFLLSGPDYITGEILHLDGGRHLTGL